MDSVFSMLLFGLVLSLVQFTLGVAMGFRFARRAWLARTRSNPHARENQRAATRLLEWTQQVADDVQTHNDTIGDVHAQLARVDRGGSVALPEHSQVVELINHLTEANETLQTRLAAAETNLQYQAAEFQAQVAEARTDALTGLANRRPFDEELAKRFAEWSRYGHNISLLLLDVDRFKDINDRYGHLTGDAILKQLANILRDARETDIVTRYGGEEFAIIMPHTDVAEAQIAAERIRQAIAAQSFVHDKVELSLTISYGLAGFESEDHIAEEIIARADAALYASKLANRNCGHTHDGRDCVPIRQVDRARSGDWQAVAAAADALRQRMHELVGDAP
jgi:diguanylate cyclase